MIDADMARFLRLDKEDFTGKRATLEQQDRNFKLVYFEVDATDSDVRGSEPLYHGGHASA